MDTCIRRTINDAVPHFGDGKMELKVDESPSSSLLSGRLFQAMQRNVATGSIDKSVHARVTKADTRYVSVGSDRIARTITFGAAFEVHTVPRGELVWAGETGSTITDTVDCGSIPLLERPDDLPALHAADPCASEAGAFSSIVEPVLLAVASATIIILLFTLRGH